MCSGQASQEDFWEGLAQSLPETRLELVRQRGSHAFLRHPDGRRLTIPVYDAVPINLLNWILAEAKVTRQDFLKLLK